MSHERSYRPNKATAENTPSTNSGLSQPTRPFSPLIQETGSTELGSETGNNLSPVQLKAAPPPQGKGVVQMGHKKKKKSTGKAKLQRHQKGQRQVANQKKNKIFQQLKRRNKRITMSQVRKKQY